MTDARSPLRALRAAAFAAVCVTLAAVGHSFTSGHEIPPGALWTAFGITGCLAWLAGGRRRGTGSIGAALVTVQGVLHLLFAGALPYGLSAPAHGSRTHPVVGTGLGTGLGMSPGPGSGLGPGSGIGVGIGPGMGTDMGMAMRMGGADTGADGPPTVLDALTDGSVGMLAAHLLAAAVCALWLARGEAALFRLVHAVGALAFSPLRLLLTAVRLPAVPRLIRPRPAATAADRVHGVIPAHTLSRRGPPAFRTARTTVPGAVAVITGRTV
ncbi:MULTISPECIES: hypothetical protein [unclassified Streptomyces]|uniref:hypothetical protein n=1 Tax=unclassified Streptomyces TaxID=2593676 RepID=UPI00081D5E9B|nr:MULTISPECIES: hypothetical protein [unclassified Streptomyces]SCF86095.1 hypothetical protein GA0115259_103783 [Streptomyces sp. MnatMP-M17]